MFCSWSNKWPWRSLQGCVAKYEDCNYDPIYSSVNIIFPFAQTNHLACCDKTLNWNGTLFYVCWNGHIPFSDFHLASISRFFPPERMQKTKQSVTEAEIHLLVSSPHTWPRTIDQCECCQLVFLFCISALPLGLGLHPPFIFHSPSVRPLAAPCLPAPQDMHFLCTHIHRNCHLSSSVRGRSTCRGLSWPRHETHLNASWLVCLLVTS